MRINSLKPTMRLVAVAVSALLLAGCGIPDDREPRNINPDDVQYDLLAPSTTMPPTPGPVAAIASIFLLGPDNRLVAVQRQLAEQQTVGSVVGSLLQGPTPAETASGLRSAIDQQTAVLGAQAQGDVAQVDISDALLKLPPQDQVRALAQIVYTATSVAGIRGVQVMVNSQVADVPRSDGSLTRDPLLRTDYTALAPPS